jgi:predicted AlkP superfamily phosphohydrolase/phosphomutase
MTRLLLIALDGATLDLLQPWMDQGHLPLLARLYRQGVGGVLMSTVPWATPTAFASLATGTNPGRHGVFDFGRLIGRDYTAFVPTNGRDVRGRTLWRILSEAGLIAGIVNMPMTYPAEAVNGFVMAGIPYPSGSTQFCHPSNLLTEMKDHGWDLARNASDDLGGSYADYYQGLVDLVRTRGEATAWLLSKYRPNFLAVHFLETDQVQHRFWQFLAGEPRHNPDGPHTDAILNLFQEAEQAVAQILAAAGPETTVCLMSDHGFGPTRYQVWPNNWLVQNGYLALKRGPSVWLKMLMYRLGMSPAAIREMAPERLKLAILQFFERQKGRALASALEEESAGIKRKGLLDRLIERLAIDFYDVDWRHSRAYSTGTTSVGYVWLNLAGRDPQGIVQPGADYEQTRQEIADALQRWEPVGQVHFREDLWQGRRLERAPDLIIRWAEPSTDVRYFQTRFSSHRLIKPVPNDYAGHRPEGLFVFHGPLVKKIPERQTADLLDLTPTMLWLLDQPVPDNMDGRVLSELFDLDRPVRQVAAARVEDDHPSGLSESDEAAIMRTLKNLGYIE